MTNRIQIDLPEKSLASFDIPVRITDINYGNHLGNDALVSILHEARLQFLSSHGYDEMNAGGTSLIMSDLAVQYKNEAFYGDTLSVHIYCGDISRISFSFYYKVSSAREGKPVVIAVARTGMVAYDYERKKIASVSQTLQAILSVD